MYKHLIFGYRNYFEDERVEGWQIVSIPFWRSRSKALARAIQSLNASPDRKHPVIITFITKL